MLGFVGQDVELGLWSIREPGEAMSIGDLTS